MKLQELLKKVKEKSGVESEELDSLISSGDIAEKEITDEEGKKLTDSLDSLMTKEAALNDPDVFNTFKEKHGPQQKKSILSEVDNKLFEMGQAVLGEEVIEEAKQKEKTSEKIDFLKDKISEAIAEKDQSGKSKQALEEMKQRLQKVQEEKDQEVQTYKEKLENQEQEFNNSLLKERFQKKAASIEFADAYKDDEIVDMITNNAWEKITSKAQPKLVEDENGKTQIKLFRKDNPEMELYGNDNKPATLDKLLEETIPAKYLKKSDGKGGEGGGEPKPKTPNGGNPKPAAKDGSVQSKLQQERAKMLNGQT